VWDVVRKEPVLAFPDTDGLASATLAPDGRRALWNPNPLLPQPGSAFNPGRVYDLASGRLVTEFPVGEGEASQIAALIAVSPDGRRLVTVRTPVRTQATAGGPAPGEWGLRALPGGEVVARAPAAAAVPADGRVFSPDSKALLLWAGEGTAQLLDAETGTVLIRWRPTGGRRPHLLAFTPDGWIAAAARGADDLLLLEPAEIRNRLTEIGLGW